MDVNRLRVFKTLSNGNICDAMGLLGLRRSAIHGFAFLVRPASVLVGSPFTVRQIPKHISASRSNKLVRHVEVSDHLAQRGDVIVIDVGGMQDVCSWGEIHSLKCQTRGVAGLIINGCVRDAEAIRKIGFSGLLPWFFPGQEPVGPGDPRFQ